MVLELRTDLLNIEILYPLHKYNGMGIAHGDTGHTVFLTVHRDRCIHHSRSHRGLLCRFRYHRSVAVLPSTVSFKYFILPALTMVMSSWSVSPLS